MPFSTFDIKFALLMSMLESMYKKKTREYLRAPHIFASFTFAAHSAFSAPSHIKPILDLTRNPFYRWTMLTLIKRVLKS